MIYFAVPDSGAFGVEHYLRDRGGALATRLVPLRYEEMLARPHLDHGTYVFSALDQLGPAQMEWACLVWDQLTAAGLRLLNDPRQVLTRYSLLRRLHELGVNRFAARLATEPLDGLRFPVFVREERGHTGTQTALLRSHAELRRAIVRLVARGHRLDELLVVEFLDTADERGFYRKYTAYRVGEHILPRSLEYGPDWMVKFYCADKANHPFEEEFAYVEADPYAAWLRRVFDIARIDYGRVDFGILDGVPQVWEINTNPTIGAGPEHREHTAVEEGYFRRVRPLRDLFYDHFRKAWQALDTPAPGTPCRIAIQVPGSLSRRVEKEREEARRGNFRSRLVEGIANNALLTRTRPAMKAVVDSTSGLVYWLLKLRAPGTPPPK